MTSDLRTAAWAIGFAALLSTVHAELVWENPRQEFKPKLDEQTVVAEFSFKNTGNQPVTIVSMTPDCASCTTAELHQKVYPPGERGVIKTIFTLGDRQGHQEKTIRVTTDDPKTPSTTLVMAVEIPRLLEITPEFSYWMVDKEAREKTVKVQCQPGIPVHLIRVISTHASIETKLKVS